jgi:hypothetical protein
LLTVCPSQHSHHAARGRAAMSAAYRLKAPLRQLISKVPKAPRRALLIPRLLLRISACVSALRAAGSVSFPNSDTELRSGLCSSSSLTEFRKGLRAHLPSSAGIGSTPHSGVSVIASARIAIEPCKAWQEASRGFEPRSLDSESRVLTVTPRGQVMIVEVRAFTEDPRKKHEAICHEA